MVRSRRRLVNHAHNFIKRACDFVKHMHHFVQRDCDFVHRAQCMVKHFLERARDLVAGAMPFDRAMVWRPFGRG
eukprot:3247685-Pleurochrysis_carterae.AAC.1